MPIKKVCSKSGCSSLIDHGQRYCDKHKEQEQSDKYERNKHYDMYQRDKRAKAFYNSKEWELVRTQRLIMDNYLCQDCLCKKRLVAADVVDHVLPLEHYPELALDIGNLLCRCHAHHNKKTAEDRKKYGG